MDGMTEKFEDGDAHVMVSHGSFNLPEGMTPHQFWCKFLCLPEDSEPIDFYRANPPQTE
jgi:hypothetical protein